jgi:chromate transporter
VARLFVALGATAVGGPAAHVAMMEDEVVRRRGWLTRDEFLDYVGAANLIPGPNSTELAIHIGRARAGWPGLLAAGAGFILPAAGIVGLVAWGYVTYGALPEAAGALRGAEPVVIAVVVQALWRLARSAVRSPADLALAAAAVAATAAGVHELAVLAAAAAVAVAVRRVRPPGGAGVAAAALPLAAPAALFGAPAGAAPFGLWPLFGVFLKTGAVLFGSGYVLLAFLRADLVERLGWLTERQLLDAIAVGQVTPGPVFTTATFVGYLLGGPAGAAVATAGIFLPAFAFVAASGPLVPRLRRSAAAGAALDGVNLASLALMAAVAWRLGRGALADPVAVVVAAAAALLLARGRVNSAWLVLGGAAVGVLRRLLGAG